MARKLLAFAFAVALACVVALIGALARSCSPSAPEDAGVHVKVSAAAPGYQYLDVSDATTRGVLLAVVRHLDAQLGYPRPSTLNDGGQATTGFDTIHHTLPIPHPTQSGRWMVPLDAAARTRLAALRVACVARLDAGTAGPSSPCAAIVGAPALIGSLDATWSDPDAGVTRPWDAGSNLLPDDDYNGALP